MIKIKSDKIKCPGCGRQVYADVYETWSDTLLPTENGFHVFCSESLMDQCELLYEDGINLQSQVYVWLVNYTRKL